MSADGIIYTNGSQVLKAVTNVQSIEISNETLTIFGVSKNDYAFKGSTKTLVSFSFLQNPALETIGPYAFYQCAELKQIDLSLCTKLNIINSYAFYGCTKTTTISLPPSLTLFGIYALSYLGITSILLPASLTNFPNALLEYTPITSITFEKGIKITSIPWRSLGRTKLKEITVPASLIEFVGSALEGTYLNSILVEEGNSKFCSIEGVLYSLDVTRIHVVPALKTTINIPSTVTRIETSAFRLTRIGYINFPSSLKFIESYAFGGGYLKNVTIPKSVEYIRGNAFEYNNQLGVVIFEEGSALKSIGSMAFHLCPIKAIVIPDGVTSLGTQCFDSCKQLMNVTLPSNIKNLGGGVFNNCHPNISINFGEGSTIMIDKQNLIMDIEQNFINQYLGSEANAKIEVPSTVSIIKHSSFKDKTNLNTIAFLGDKLTRIEDYAFSGCTSLENIELTNNLVYIGSYAFYMCSKLTIIIFPSKLSSLLEFSFYSCSLLHTINCGSIQKISRNCFRNCYSLCKLTLSQTLNLIEEYGFYGCSSLTEVLIPSDMKHIYQRAFEKSGLINISFDMNCSIVVLDELSFYGCSKLESITNFPNSLRIIGVSCFCGSAITSFTVPTNTLTIGDSCFSGCLFLKTFIIPESCMLNNLGISVFEGCLSLSSIHASNEFFSDEYGALFTAERDHLLVFPPASKIRFFCFPEKVQLINYGAFLGCTNIEYVMIPEGFMHTIGQRAFEGCSQLKTINIPSSITSIGKDSFKGCSHIGCGQTIDLKNKYLIETLINEGKFPNSGLNSCVKTCKCRVYRFSPSYISSFILIMSK